MNMLDKITRKIFARNRLDGNISSVEPNNKFLSDLPPSYESLFLRSGIQKKSPKNNFIQQQQISVCGNCMGCIEYNMCMREDRRVIMA